MKRIIAFVFMLCCIAGAAAGESAAYFAEKQISVYDISSEYMPVERGVARYSEDIAGSVATYDCLMKCAVLSDAREDGERILELRLTMLVDDFDPAQAARDIYVCPAIYDYYTGARCSIRDSVGAVSWMNPEIDGAEITVKGKVTAAEHIFFDNYFVYTVDYRFEMPEGYDGLVVGCFTVFEFDGHAEFIEKKNTTVYERPDAGPGGVFIRIK